MVSFHIFKLKCQHKNENRKTFGNIIIRLNPAILNVHGIAPILFYT